MSLFAGVDVGGRRKGFHLAVVDGASVVAGPARLPDPDTAADWLAAWRPALTAVDSPVEPAAPGERSRTCERALASAVCGIRYTPAADLLPASAYYEWIVHGLELYAALRRRRLATVECFPTASWTRWGGPRAGCGRALWSAAVLDSLRLDGSPARLGQDGRDALGAALTARAHASSETEAFGSIVVPLARDGHA